MTSSTGAEAWGAPWSKRPASHALPSSSQKGPELWAAGWSPSSGQRSGKRESETTWNIFRN